MRNKLFAGIGLLTVKAGLFLVLLNFPALATEAPWVAGVKPDLRPAEAPKIEKVKHGKKWRAKALAGVSKPYPEHVVKFLDDQGNWFTPFTRPGMPGPYDIRGLHNK